MREELRISSTGDGERRRVVLHSWFALYHELHDNECGKVALKGRESAPHSVSEVGEVGARFKSGTFRAGLRRRICVDTGQKTVCDAGQLFGQ